MTDLHDLLDRGAQGFRPSPDGWGEVQRRVHVRHRRRRQASGLTAAVIALAATGFLVRAFDQPTPQVPVGTPSAVPDRLQAQVTAQIDVGPFPQAIAVGEGGVWVDVPANAPDASDASPEIVRIDPNSDNVVARIPVPEGESDIAAGEGSVWVTRAIRPQGGQLVLQTLRIDPATNEIVSTIPGVGGQVAVGEGFVWTLAAGPDDTTTVLVKIDPGSGSVISSEPLGATVTEIVIGGGSVWLSTLPDPESGTLIQVDAATNQILRTLRLPFHYAPVFASGELWVPTCCHNNTVSLVRVDPSTGDTAKVPVEVGDGLPFANAFGHLLLMSERGALSDLNPTTGSVEALATSDWPAAHGTVVFDPVTASVWVSNYQRTVTRIDLKAAPGLLDGVTAGMVLGEGTAHSTPWTLVVTGNDQPAGLELRWDGRSGPDAVSLEAGDGLSFAWHTFGRFEPDNAVIFGLVPAETATVRQEPGQGLPETEVDVIDVPGADWHAFVFTSYAAIGVVSAQDPAGDEIANMLMVPSGCQPMLETVEAFLAARQAGEGAEVFLTPEAIDRFGRIGVAPLYNGYGGGPYVDSTVLFLDGPYGEPAGCEAGVRLAEQDGTATDDTLLVYGDEAKGPPIAVARSSADGP